MKQRTIGIVFETFETYARAPGDPEDFDAEYEPEATIVLLEGALSLLGHQSLRLGSPHALLDAVSTGRLSHVDAALTIAEGFGSRNREAWAPVLLEMCGIPTLGSDALTLSLSLDKAWAHGQVSSAGVPVPPFSLMTSAKGAETGELPAPFPLFVKPRWEGTAKGIRESSRVEDRAALALEVDRVVREYHQPALVERFISGPEYTVTVVGNDPPRTFPVLQRALDLETRIGVHALEPANSQASDSRHSDRETCTPGSLDSDIESSLKQLAVQAYEALECLDFARVDFRFDSDHQPFFLEINTLPTFAPSGTFGILAELEGRTPAELVADVLNVGLQRLGL